MPIQKSDPFDYESSNKVEITTPDYDAFEALTPAPDKLELLSERLKAVK